ncbi:hypothetical protein B296_00010285 [Ensete ventricosum]|uniref:Uncharacterized protein n=1 Tax=Ensete ventricosum TaxID=4639 RepID=A0A427ALU1_ENSVE|nr:hypothetical protein B296_00010285 [Ensete ventricosum]
MSKAITKSCKDDALRKGDEGGGMKEHYLKGVRDRTAPFLVRRKEIGIDGRKSFVIRLSGGGGGRGDRPLGPNNPRLGSRKRQRILTSGARSQLCPWRHAVLKIHEIRSTCIIGPTSVRVVPRDLSN